MLVRSSPRGARTQQPADNNGTDGLGGYRIQNRQSYGIELSLLASVVLGGSSIPRAIRSGKPVPTLLSVLATFGMFTFGNAFRKSL